MLSIVEACPANLEYITTPKGTTPSVPHARYSPAEPYFSSGGTMGANLE